MLVALIALAVVMLIWVIVTWDEPGGSSGPENRQA
jgi:hypothetical protein